MTTELLKTLFDYDPVSGALLHRERSPGQFYDSGKISAATRCRQWNGLYAGKQAGRDGGNGYLKVSVNYKKMYVHRVAWQMIHGVAPKVIDHINGNRSDNRLENLRSVEHSDNAKNARKRRDNKSGATGVHWSSSTRKWCAEITVDGERRVLGYFSNMKLAQQVRREAQNKMGFHQNHGRDE